MLLLNKSEVEIISQQIFSLIYSAKLYSEPEVLTLLYFLLTSDPLILKEFKSKKYDKELERFDEKEEINYYLSQQIEYKKYKMIFAELVFSIFHDIDEDDKLFDYFITFIDFLATYHESIYFYLYGKDCFKDIIDYLDYEIESI